MTNPASITRDTDNSEMVFESHLDSFILTGQLRSDYRDSAIWTTLPGRENFYLFTRIITEIL